MYPRSKFQELLLEIRQEMAREADFDLDLFAEIVRTGAGPQDPPVHSMTEQPTAGEGLPRTSSRRA